MTAGNMSDLALPQGRSSVFWASYTLLPKYVSRIVKNILRGAYTSHGSCGKVLVQYPEGKAIPSDLL